MWKGFLYVVRKIIKNSLPYGFVFYVQCKKRLKKVEFNQNEIINYIKRTKQIDILYSRNVYSYARCIQAILKDNGIYCEIYSHDQSPFLNNEMYYIILNQSGFDFFPKHYFLYNTEPTIYKKYFTIKWLGVLNNSIKLFDYAKKNIFYLEKKLKKNIEYLPIVLPYNYNNTKKDIDVLFYGRITDRRSKILNILKNKINIKIIDNLFYDNIVHILSRTKIVINLHMDARINSRLEIFRIIECLSYGCLVISEITNDVDLTILNNDIVDYVKMGDVNKIIELCNFYLNNDKVYFKKITNVKKYVENQYKIFYNHVRLLIDKVK